MATPVYTRIHKHIRVHTAITCTLPSGAGTNNSLIVTTIADATSPHTPVDYEAPALTRIDPLDAPSEGNIVLTLTGT